MADDPRAAPIGVFDSGVGGLSVLRELRRLLPHEDVVYVADHAYVPYGRRDANEIVARSEAIAGHLIAAGAKLVVVACNTATVSAIAHLRARFDAPFVGTEPAVKPAAATSATGVVGVLATLATLGGGAFQRLVETHAADVRVLTVPARGLVERIEAGDLDGPETRALVAEHLAPLVAAGIDRLVLGSTHFPFLRDVIADVVGADVLLVESGPAIARQSEAMLAERGLLRPAGRAGTLAVRSTRVDEGTAALVRRLLGEDVGVVQVDC